MYRFYGDLFELETRSLAKAPDLSIDPVKLAAYAKSKKPACSFFQSLQSHIPDAVPSKVQSLIELLPDTLIVVDEAYMEFSPMNLFWI